MHGAKGALIEGNAIGGTCVNGRGVSLKKSCGMELK